MPLIIGTNAKEASFFRRYVRNGGQSLVPTTPEGIDRLFKLTDPSSRDRILAAYPDYPHGDAIPRLTGDLAFWYPTCEVAAQHSAVAPTRVYRFDYASPKLRLLGFGATHGSEIDYVLGRNMPSGAAGPVNGGRTARRLSQKVIELWARFAHEGSPGEPWPLYDPGARKTLIIGKRQRVDSNPRSEFLEAWTGYHFWDDIA